MEPDDVKAARGRTRKKRYPITVTINGLWNKTPDEIEDILTNALHKHGLCGCWGPMNGYTMSVTATNDTLNA